MSYLYHKNSKILDTWYNSSHNCAENDAVQIYRAVLLPMDVYEMADSTDPDQTAPNGAVWSGSPLFAQTYLPQYLHFLQYNN